MAVNVTIHLGCDAKISTQILPTYKLELKYTLHFDYIEVVMLYHNTTHKLPFTSMYFSIYYSMKSTWLDLLKVFLIEMKNNKWCNFYMNNICFLYGTDVWIIRFYTADDIPIDINLELCNDAKNQFINELQGLVFTVDNYFQMSKICTQIANQTEI